MTHYQFQNKIWRRAHHTGFATLEIILALSIIISALATVLLVSSGNQNILADSSTEHVALLVAEQLLHTTRADASTDFKLLVATSSTTSTFTTAVSENTDDFFVTRATATVSWKNILGQSRHVSLTSILADTDSAESGETCEPDPDGDWSHPHVVNSTTDVANLIGDSTSTYTITDINAYKQHLYITANADTKTKPTFFIFNITDPTHPTLQTKIDTATTSQIGPAALAIASSSTHSFAYIASASSFAKGQLQIIDLATSTPYVMTTYKIDPTVVATAGVGNSIFYSHGLIYLGLTGTTNPEFHIIDVHDPLHPQLLGSYFIGSAINAISVVGAYAYIVHPKNTSFDEQLTILNVSDPTHPFRIGGFSSPSGIGGNGKHIYTVAHTIYLGKTASNISGNADTIPEFYTLDTTQPSSLTTIGSFPLTTTGESIDRILVRNSLLYLLTNKELLIKKISPDTPWTATPFAILALPGVGSITEPSMDCEGNYVYVGSNNTADKGYLSVIESQ